VCRSKQEQGGPRRCSSDARGALQESTAAISSLESRQAAAEAELAAKGIAIAVANTGPPPRKPRCFFCDDITTNAAHLTRRGKICCHRCWPDIRLTDSPGGGLSA